MPLYTYTCPCGLFEDKWMTIEEMLDFEQSGLQLCKCQKHFLERDYRPRRHITFKAGVYENVADEPLYIDTAQKLVDACRKNDNSSVYMKDMAGLFGAKENRWI